jgi:hypothetical protein
MILCAFGMQGQVRLDFREAQAAYRQGESAGPFGSGRGETGETAGWLWQGTLHAAGRPRMSAGVRSAARPADRTLLAGWLAAPAPGAGRDADVGVLASRLQELLDTDGPAAVRKLRGDFTIAHLTADRATLRLYRGVTSMVPLFWTVDGDVLRWATDPLYLLEGPPSLSDVAVDLLPMIVAEHGFPRDRSWFHGVHRLPAGTCLTLRSGGRPVVEVFDELAPVPEVPGNVQAAASGLRERLHQACARMLPAVDPVVLLLSGGIDSGAAAVELGQASTGAFGFHFTIDFPGFEEDRKAAELVAVTCGLEFLPYDMAPHVMPGGDYADAPTSGALPQTHTPLRSMAAAGQEAHSRGATFVVSGMGADQILAADVHRGLFEVAGWSVLNPLVVGEPIWQLLRRTVAGSLWASFPVGWRDYLRYARALRRRDPTIALPHRDTIVHPVGLSEEAADQVTRALRDAAARAGEQPAAAPDGRGRGTLPSVSSVFELNGFLDAPNLQAATLNDLLPRQCLAASPYFDRDVVEYVLALPTSFRVGFGYGATIDKFALRAAYAGSGLPPQIGGRTQQAILAAFASVYVNQNLERCRSLLGDDSRLRALGVLSESFTRGLSAHNAHRYGAEIALLCVIENWLRVLAP